MRLGELVIALSLGLALPATALAQAGTTSAPAADPAGTSAAQNQSSMPYDNDYESEWLASGFVGSNFGASATGGTVDFGGSVGYLYKSWIGGEFLAGFTPDFEAQNLALFAGERPQVNSYMANAVAAIPLGGDRQWQPYISGGFGAVTLRSDVLNNDTGNDVSNVFDPDDTRPGGNIGAGIMAFAGSWGVRGDIRYFRAFERDTSDSNISTGTGNNGAASEAAASILPGLDFWRANIGVALRW